MVVDVAHGASPVLGTPRKLFTRAPLGTYAFSWVTQFAVNGDGTRFVTLRNVDSKGAGPRITVVQNWVAGFAGGGKGGRGRWDNRYALAGSQTPRVTECRTTNDRIAPHSSETVMPESRQSGGRRHTAFSSSEDSLESS